MLNISVKCLNERCSGFDGKEIHIFVVRHPCLNPDGYCLCICIINVCLSYLFPLVYNNSNLFILCVTHKKWRLKNKHTYIHTTLINPQKVVLFTYVA